MDRSNQAAVDAYNAKINQHRNNIDLFNRQCAGKQSQSAREAAQELN